jgi:hypothetical protein
MKKTYIISNTVKVPFVVNSGQAHRPPQIKFRTFKKGEMVQGELKHSNNKPSFILVGKMGVIPLECVQEVNSTPIAVPTTSNASGDTAVETADEKNKEVIIENPKIRYADAFLIGALVGFLGVHFAQKKGYIPDEDKKYKLYGALGVGLLGAYLVYRSQSSKKTVKPVVKTAKKE